MTTASYEGQVWWGVWSDTAPPLACSDHTIPFYHTTFAVVCWNGRGYST